MNYIDANIKQLTRIHIRPLPKEQYEPLNYHLKKDILDAGDAIGSRTAAKCIRTHWKMHEKYESFKLLCDSAIDFANKLCESDRYLRQTDENGVVQKMKFTTDKSWGLIYKKGDDTATHTHFPALWSWTYCVFGCELCAPLMFSDAEVKSKTGQLIFFPSWMQHGVPTHTCDHDRIVVAGNIFMSGWL